MRIVRRRLLTQYLTITALLLLLLEVPLGLVFARLERETLVAGVRHDAVRIAAFAAEPLAQGESGVLQRVASDYGHATAGRVVIVDRAGNLQADSDGSAEQSFSSRSEVAAALAGREALGFRHSTTLGMDLLYVAVPVNSGGRIRGAVRITYPSSFVAARVRRNWLVLLAIGLAALVVVALVSIRLARSVTTPVSALVAGAARLGNGDLTTRVRWESGPPEVRILTWAFNATAEKLESLVRAQTEFVADASHQLRTPLAALRLRLENLEAEVSGAAREDAGAALGEVHRLSRLVDGLLMLARAELRPGAPEAVDVSQVLAERRASWLPLAEEQDVRLALEACSGLVARFTPGHLDQVLDNLVANAIEESPAGATVRLSALAHGGAIHVHVVDQGRGMDADIRARAFQRLWTAGEARKRVGGAGIGLSIAHRLVTNDGGEIELEEGPGGGLDAHIRLRPGTQPLAPTRTGERAPVARGKAQVPTR